MSAVDVLERVTKLDALIRDHADEAERNGNLPDALFAALKDAGVFRIALPASYGGEGASFAEQSAVIQELSRVDGSTGWIAMILSTAPPVLMKFPSATFDAIFADGPDAIAGGTLAPKGSADVVDGGYRVKGQWPFGSGTHFADWIAVHCLVTEDGELRASPNGGPELRLMLLPRRDVEIVDTWHVAGLKGTGSNDVKVSDVFVAHDRTAVLLGGTSQIDCTLSRIPILSYLGLSLASCAVGMARGAMQDIIELAKTKRPAFKPGQRVAEDQVARFELGQADLLLDAASALLERHISVAWDIALADGETTMIQRARTRAAAWQVARMSFDVVEAAYRIGGGTSVYESCSLQRRMRDMHALVQHAAISRDAAGWLGAFLTGEAVPDARL